MTISQIVQLFIANIRIFVFGYAPTAKISIEYEEEAKLTTEKSNIVKLKFVFVCHNFDLGMHHACFVSGSLCTNDKEKIKIK